jgi:dipeptidyl aminopeptidase/acylaminoacyl peptidase
MRSSVIYGFASLVVWLSTALHAAQIVPAEAFGKIPQVSQVVLSPDGNMLAWYDESGDAPRVVMFDIAKTQYKHIVSIKHGLKFRSAHWADDETLLITASAFVDLTTPSGRRAYEMWRTMAVDVAGGAERVLLMTDGYRELATGANLIATNTTKPKSVIMATREYSFTAADPTMATRLHDPHAESGWLSEVFEVDTRTGKGKVLEIGTPFTLNWIVNKQGEVVARSEWDAQSKAYRVLSKQGGSWREVFRQEGPPLDLKGLTRDESAIVAGARNSAGREILETLPLDGTAIQVLFEDPAYDVTSVTYDSITHAPVGVDVGGLERTFHWFDKEAERRFRSVAAAFPGKRVRVGGHSVNNERVLASVEGPSSPEIYYIVDFQNHKADIVGEAYPALAGIALGEVRSLSYKARDGASVPAYLTIPAGSNGKDLPLVVLPHGGPQASDSDNFDWWPQFLAARGYAVLQPQFRGSTGFGAAWTKAGQRQWGGLMQDDVTDGVKALIDQGIADSHRVAIVGASYGGYAALAGAAFTPDIYRCAVSVNGVSDLPAMLGYLSTHAGAESDSVIYWKENIGSAFDANTIDKSPARAAQQVKIPVLLIHSSEDTVVPIAQSETMNRALVESGKTVSFVKLPGDDHWLSRSDTRVRVLKEIDGFLDKCLRNPH